MNNKKLKKSILYLLTIPLLIIAILLITDYIASWHGEKEYISPDNKHIMTITSDKSNAFDAPYSIRIADKERPDTAYDFYVYNISEEPTVSWDGNTVTVKFPDRKDNEAVYEIEISEKDGIYPDAPPVKNITSADGNVNVEIEDNSLYLHHEPDTYHYTVYKNNHIYMSFDCSEEYITEKTENAVYLSYKTNHRLKFRIV